MTVVTMHCALGAIGAFIVGWIEIDWSKWGEFFLAFFSFVMCGLLMGMYFTTSIWVCYAVYIAFVLLYNMVITIAQ